MDNKIPDQDGGKLARVEERGDQENKTFVVVLSADEDGREKDLRSFGVEGGGRYDPVKQKAERFAERVNAAHQAALTAERKRVLEMVEKIVYEEIKKGGMFGPSAESLAVKVSALSRLEGEEKT